MNFADALKTFLQVIVLGFFWRQLSAHWADNSFGKGMAVIY